MMFRKILVANRGEIACRIIRTLRRLGIGAVAIYSDADRYAPHVRMADEAVGIGQAPAVQSYLSAARVLDAARRTGAEAIHPGYGFLSENADFAEACAGSGISFIGPSPAQIRIFGLKHTARDAARDAGLGLLPGSGVLESAAHAAREASVIGYPVMLKSTAGGGGIGMQICRGEADLSEAFERTSGLAGRNFGNAGVYVEAWVEQARHVEVQIFGDGKGRVLALGARDCSLQRRHQKLLEETPPPWLTEAMVSEMQRAAVRLGESVCYANAGTVEFIYDLGRDAFYFLEVNTRLQVEHCVTEAVTGIDLVEWMIRAAAADPAFDAVFAAGPPARAGAAIEARLYAENPARDFRPSAGLLSEVHFPARARIETWVESGAEVSPFYDPLLAKIIVHGADRAAAVAELQDVLDETRLSGIETNLAHLRQISRTDAFVAGKITTRTLETIPCRPRSLEILESGTLTTVQDLPGRQGYWHVGIPPSGPMDALSFANANAAVGNPPGAAALEITLSGPSLRFDTACLICLTGAEMTAALDDAPVPWNTPIQVAKGAVLRIGQLRGAGARAYLAIRGGIEVPGYLGSRSTFTLGHFGGFAGRALTAGDILHLGPPGDHAPPGPVPAPPHMSGSWQIAVAEGPHAAPDFFTEAGIEAFYAASWEVHYNSSRTGVRLVGPKPGWARKDGGEAGLHPSNIHDTPYAVGAVDFTGDMPVILGPDGPSLGGFVCPCTILDEDLWKIGQLRAGDSVRFVRRLHGAVLHRTEPHGEQPLTVYRRAGESNILVEYGPPVLDLELRLRVHALMQAMQGAGIRGMIDITPGIRSLQLHFDPALLPQTRLLELLIQAEENLPRPEDMQVKSRIVHLPLCWDDPSIRVAIERYMQGVRADAPWCPSNIEFIRRINGLDSEAEVKRIVFDAAYLVLGLGDVYLGAPVATPIDPRHRLVTTKYNPARTWTPENAVGIGGAYLCIYGMEGPGGYQFVGRTCQVWNSFRATADFRQGTPWLLRFFDQIRFYEVNESELLDFRADFAHGAIQLRIEETEFSLRDYRMFLARNAADIAGWKFRQQQAFEAERARWSQSEIFRAAEADPAPPIMEASLAPGELVVGSPVAGSVWRVAVSDGQAVAAGDLLVSIESMKMEISVVAPRPGLVCRIAVAEGREVRAGQALCILRPQTGGET
jgi:urea carboxylase